jgi:hypothetical protein
MHSCDEKVDQRNLQFRKTTPSFEFSAAKSGLKEHSDEFPFHFWRKTCAAWRPHIKFVLEEDTTNKTLDLLLSLFAF